MRRTASSPRGPTAWCALDGLVPGTAYVVQLDVAPSDLAFYVVERLLDRDRARRRASARCSSMRAGTRRGRPVRRDRGDRRTSSSTTTRRARPRTRRSRSTSTPRRARRARSAPADRRCASTASASSARRASTARPPRRHAAIRATHTCAAGIDACIDRRRERARRRRPGRRDAARARRQRPRSVTRQICSSPAHRGRLLRVRRRDARRDLGLRRSRGPARATSTSRCSTRPATSSALSYWEQPERAR